MWKLLVKISIYAMLLAILICIFCGNCTTYSDSVGYMWKQTEMAVCGNELNID